MKTINTVIALMLLSVASFASVSVVSEENVFTIQYNNTEKNNVRVSILNNKNQEIFSESFYHVTSFKRPYNFSQLAEGEYTIVIEDKNGKQTEKISYHLNKVVSYVHVARIPKKDNKFWLNVANNGMEVLSVRIFDQDGNEIHSQSLEVNGTMSTVYNLNAIKNIKSVSFEVIDGSGKMHKATF